VLVDDDVVVVEDEVSVDVVVVEEDTVVEDEDGLVGGEGGVPPPGGTLFSIATVQVLISNTADSPSAPVTGVSVIVQVSTRGPATLDRKTEIRI
jgi:hypothetical protein